MCVPLMYQLSSVETKFLWVFHCQESGPRPLVLYSIQQPPVATRSLSCAALLSLHPRLRPSCTSPVYPIPSRPGLPPCPCPTLGPKTTPRSLSTSHPATPRDSSHQPLPACKSPKVTVNHAWWEGHQTGLKVAWGLA